MTDPVVDSKALYAHLMKNFSLEEINTLCFILGVEHENFPKEKDGKAREFVRHMVRYDRLQELEDAINNPDEFKFDNPLSAAHLTYANIVPKPFNKLFGREDDLAAVKARLLHSVKEDYFAPIFITGNVGIGKTDLVLTLARDSKILETFVDGIFWVSLGPDPEESKIPSELRNLGHCLVKMHAQESVIADNWEDNLFSGDLKRRKMTLQQLAADKRVLFIIDDVWEREHLVPFLIQGENNGILVTTRNKLVSHGSPSQDIFSLSGLLPQHALEIIKQQNPEIITEENKQAIQEHIAKFDGYPFMLQIISSLLNRDLHLYSSFDELFNEIKEKTLMQQFLPPSLFEYDNEASPQAEALFTLSYENLSTTEIQKRFTCLGFFAPNTEFDLAALQAVWNVKDLKQTVRELENIKLLHSLKDGKYQIDYLLYLYASYLLNNDNDTYYLDATERYITYYFELAKSSDVHEPSENNRVQKNLPHILRALDKLKGRGVTEGPEDYHRLLEFVLALDEHWKVDGRGQKEWLVEAFKIVKTPSEQARLADRIGRVLSEQGIFVGALTWLDEAKKILLELGGEEASQMLGHVYIHSASVYYQQGKHEKVVVECERSIALMEENKTSSDSVFAEALFMLASIKGKNGKYTEAKALLMHSHSIAKFSGDEYLLARVEDHLAITLRNLGEFNEAMTFHDRSLDYWLKFPDITKKAIYQSNKAESLWYRGRYNQMVNREAVANSDFQKAKALRQDAVEACRAAKHTRLIGHTLMNRAWIYIELKQWDLAELDLNETSAILGEYEFSHFQAETDRALATLALNKAIDYAQALAFAKKSLNTSNKADEAKSYQLLGVIYKQQEEWHKSRENLSKCLQFFDDADNLLEMGLTYYELASVYQATGQQQEFDKVKRNLKEIIEHTGILSSVDE